VVVASYIDIPQAGHLKFRSYTPWTITEYGLLKGMLCETKPRDNMQHRHTAEGKKLEDTVPLLKKIV
jgi:hypothetical protein